MTFIEWLFKEGLIFIFFTVAFAFWLFLIYLTARVWYKGKESETKSTYRRLVKSAHKLGSITEKMKRIKQNLNKTEDKK